MVQDSEYDLDRSQKLTKAKQAKQSRRWAKAVAVISIDINKNLSLCRQTRATRLEVNQGHQT